MKKKIFLEMAVIIVISGAVVFLISYILSNVLFENHSLITPLFSGVFASYLVLELFISFWKSKSVTFENTNMIVGGVLTIVGILGILMQIGIALLGWSIIITITGLILFCLAFLERKTKIKRIKYEKRIYEKIKK